jgi:F0F1-type ATP synthase membrane subunit b/b'
MEILLQLGANKTAFIQFVLFVVSIGFLTIYVYGPYFKAYDERLKRTKGADTVAKEAADEAKNLVLIFQTKARETNEKIKNIFDLKKTEAGKLSAGILSDAKATAEKSAAAARVDIENQKSKAQADVQALATEISTQLKQKFEGGL